MPEIRRAPDAADKLAVLAEGAQYDVCLASCNANRGGGTGRMRDPLEPLRRWIYPAHVPGKGRVHMLKVLQTNACIHRCTYCRLRATEDSVPRVSFAPEELARLFMDFVSAGEVRGLFLSSGVGTRADVAMERMVRTVEILRMRHHFAGYIHLKILPGAAFDLVAAAARYANRLSVNLEAPTPEGLAAIAPGKDFRDDLLLRMKWAGDIIRSGSRACSQTTQFVVGAGAETDMDILRTVDWTYRKLHTFRAYFSAYQPCGGNTGTRPFLPPLQREFRLYQSDFLLRGYGFRLPDLVFDSSGGIPGEVDPKTAHAMMHPELFPLDVNSAEEGELLRVPGIGPISARRICERRSVEPFHSPAELAETGAVVHRAAPYLEISGRRAGAACAQQWLLEGPRPEEWRTGIDPLAPDPGGRYVYPGQQGRKLVYAAAGSDRDVRCR